MNHLTTYLNLLNNSALLLTLVYLFDFSRSWIRIRNLFLLNFINGIGVGMIGMFIMYMNMPLDQGVIIDSRTIVLSISGIFWGPFPTLVAMLMTSIFRYFQGGAGLLAGELLILMAGAVGMIWRMLCKKELTRYRFVDFYVLGLLVHSLWVVILHFSLKRFGIENLTQVMMPVLIIYPVITGLIGTLFVSRLDKERIIETLRKNDETFSIVADYNTNWDYWMTPDGQLKYCSRSCLEVSGYSREEFINNPTLLQQIVYHEDKSLLEKHLLMKKQRLRDFLDFRIVRKDGNLIWINHSCTPVYGNNGEYLGHRASNQDITPRKLAELEIVKSREEIEKLLETTERSRIALLSLVEDQRSTQNKLESLNANLENKILERTEQLVLANKELEAFSYSVSHDLRAPIRGIIGFSNILIQEHGEAFGEEERRLLNIVRDSAKRMGQLIDDLLAFSRLARKEVEISKTDMHELVHHVLTEITMQHGPHRAEIIVDELHAANCDASLIRQVWINLISNAIKFSSKREVPCIKIRSCHHGNTIEYSVEDNGAGFDSRYKDKLFGVFQRLHSNREFDGTGIGLANVKRIVSRHGGYVSADGEPDNGARFSFFLPENLNH
ncbi:protein containing PAS domain S-box [Bacteroidales bacterium 6E]|nr:protein containing PAS domain S-box [Bacteroidales bacterium 6E]